jgi:SAM-dependent methyltransferase
VNGTRGAYAFSNDSPEAKAQHEALAALLDEFTTQRLVNVVELWGAKCADIATGGGSIAQWLAHEVGPTGSVLATDLNPCPIHISPGTPLRVLQHDITSNNPFGQDYDLIHARLLLNHLPTRREVLHRLALRLAPGGVLVTSDFWPTMPIDFVVKAPTLQDETRLQLFQKKMLLVLHDHGNDRTWSRTAARWYEHEGLTDVRTVIHGGYWRGGGPGCRLLIAGMQQLSKDLQRSGLTAEEQALVRGLLADPRVLLHGHSLYSTSGRRAAASEGGPG